MYKAGFEALAYYFRERIMRILNLLLIINVTCCLLLWAEMSCMIYYMNKTAFCYLYINDFAVKIQDEKNVLGQYGNKGR